MTQANQRPYCRMPAIHEDRVVFVSEDDLWEVPRHGGRAHRLTSGQGAMSWPSFSPDGTQLALISEEEGSSEVYVMPSFGGPMRRLTFDDSAAIVIGWNQAGDAIRFASSRTSAHRQMHLFEVSVTGGQPRSLNVGEGTWFSDEERARVLGRHRYDLARWKRYRGGLAGELWVDVEGDDAWRRLFPDESAGCIRPMWLNDRIYYVSDREGHGNIYSCLPDGSDIQRHTDHIGFYVRATQTDGTQIVYTCGGDLYVLDLATHASVMIEVASHSPRTQLRRRFVDAADYVESYALHPHGHHLCLTVRGKAYNFGLWEGAVRQTGEPHGVRHRLADYLPSGDTLVMISDACEVRPGEEFLELHDPTGLVAPRRVELDAGVTLGRVIELKVCPVGRRVAVANHRQELWDVDLDTGEAHRIDQSKRDRITEFDWSPCGQWLVYAKNSSAEMSVIMLHDASARVNHQLSTGEFKDSTPAFDPEGRYIYFVSYRTFNPTYGNLFFELGLMRGQQLCLMTLRADQESPFLEKPRPLDHKEKDEEDEEEDDLPDDERAGEPAGEEATDAKESAEDVVERVEIDLEGIAHRVIMFPIGESLIHQVEATGERVFFTSSAPQASLNPKAEEEDDEDSPASTLFYWSFEERKLKRLHQQISGLTLSHDRKALALWSAQQLRVISASSSEPDEEDEEEDDEYTRKSGWIDLERLSVEVDPVQEWHQMLAEAWRLMRDDFWREDMSGVDWPEVYARYAPLVDRVASRGEFSDLVWTMQGELGTSHTYEFGGDYREGPSYQAGHLGAEVLWDAQAARGPGDEGIARGAYRISHILQGDDWSIKAGSPLRRPGLDVKEGDLVLALNGQPLDATHGLDERLVNLAGQEVELRLYTPGDEATRLVTIKTLPDAQELRYREWVRTRREWVHETSGGLVGYVHIPDMGPHGYAEFHRGYAAERARQALIVDVRFNGGGHVSSLILEKLRRAPLGFDLSRYDELLVYPQEGPRGPVVALTNEYAGSDGDIFSHGFKMLKIGPLIGRRTWGGVIGVWPRHTLVDGSVTTQPAYSFWFKDVGFALENHGTVPDEEVEDSPHAQAEGDDVQLDAALQRALMLLDVHKPDRPESFAPFPNLKPPDTLD